MSIDASELEIDFYLQSSPNIVELETLQISHPSFSQVFYLTYNDTLGFTAGLGDGGSAYFRYVPMSIRGSTLATDLDYGITVSLGDLGNIIQAELDRVEADDTWAIYPEVIYRAYRSDRLDAPMRGPIKLIIADYTYNDDGFAFKATAPDIKMSGTGNLYTLERFPTLLAYFYA